MFMKNKNLKPIVIKRSLSLSKLSLLRFYCMYFENSWTSFKTVKLEADKGSTKAHVKKVKTVGEV